MSETRLFRISSTKGKRSVLIKGTTIQEVVAEAVLKLKKLPEVSYRVSIYFIIIYLNCGGKCLKIL